MNYSNVAIKAGLAVLLLGAIGNAVAETTNGTATATVITPLTVSETKVLGFGEFAVGTTGGTVTVTDAGLISAGADIDLLAATGAQQGIFDISGEANKAITVSVSPNATLSDGAATPNTMSLTTSPQASLPTSTGGAGTVTLSVGGVLTVVGGQTPGTYSTANTLGVPYTVTVNYN